MIADIWKNGVRVEIASGYGYSEMDPIAFRRSQKPLRGTVYANQGPRIYIKLDDGRKVYTSAHEVYTRVIE
jgi:hypothetical protein